ncbi:MAG: translocation-enhancing protein TepA [Lachnospiraceae bacterium]|jgi:ATP-dependent protease ClpP protease subunit|nr:translocation-enhancing protein TepA [Lachnospiraceae bacterium]
MAEQEKMTPEEYQDTLKELGQTQLPFSGEKNPRGNIICMSIIGEVEGHMALPPQNKTTKYEHILPQLAAVRENQDIDGVLLLINTVGGDIEAGLAIAEMIADLGKPSVSLVLGGGHSIGVPLAVSAQYSYIVPSASMTIHPVRTNGLVIGVAQTFEYLERIQDRIIGFVVRNSNMKEERFRQLMLNTEELAKDVGSILMGEEAVREGLIDEVGGLDHAIEKLYSFIAQRRKES